MSLLKIDFFNLSAVSQEALSRRLANSDEYTVNEIEAVSSCLERLFPPDFAISKELTETFRLLAKYTRVDLRPRNLSSHRKYIGPVIVMCKQMLFKIVGVIMKDTLNGQEIFNRHLLKALAIESSRKS